MTLPQEDSTNRPSPPPQDGSSNGTGLKPSTTGSWLKPARGLVLLALKTEDQLQDRSAGGIILPPISCMKNTGRIFGVVLAVGGAPRIIRHRKFIGYDHNWTDLEFGDLVECSRWTTGLWMIQAINCLFGDPSPTAERIFGSGVEGETYTVTNEHMAAFMNPEQIICRWARRDWLFHGRGEAPRPRPIADRIMVRRQAQPEMSPGGIVLPHWMHRDEALGEVVAVGDRVRDVVAGDWVLTRTDCGTRMKDEDGTVYTILHEHDALIRWDEEPSEETKRNLSVEVTGAIQ